MEVEATQRFFVNQEYNEINNPHLNMELFQKWKQSVQKKQMFYGHCLLTRTWEIYTLNEIDYLKFKIGYLLYGPPKKVEAVKDVDVTYFRKLYEEPIQKNTINKLCQIIKEISHSKIIHIAFLFTMAYDNGKEYEHPVMRVLKGNKENSNTYYFLDSKGRIYRNWNDFLDYHENMFFCFCFPKNGFYTFNKKSEVEISYSYESKKEKINSLYLFSIFLQSSLGSELGSAHLLSIKQNLNLSSDIKKIKDYSEKFCNYTNNLVEILFNFKDLPVNIVNFMKWGRLTVGGLTIITQILYLLNLHETRSDYPPEKDFSELILSILFLFHTKVQYEVIVEMFSLIYEFRNECVQINTEHLFWIILDNDNEIRNKINVIDNTRNFITELLWRSALPTSYAKYMIEFKLFSSQNISVEDGILLKRREELNDCKMFIHKLNEELLKHNYLSGNTKCILCNLSHADAYYIRALQREIRQIRKYDKFEMMKKLDKLIEVTNCTSVKGYYELVLHINKVVEESNQWFEEIKLRMSLKKKNKLEKTTQITKVTNTSEELLKNVEIVFSDGNEDKHMKTNNSKRKYSLFPEITITRPSGPSSALYENFLSDLHEENESKGSKVNSLLNRDRSIEESSEFAKVNKGTTHQFYRTLETGEEKWNVWDYYETYIRDAIGPLSKEDIQSITIKNGWRLLLKNEYKNVKIITLTVQEIEGNMEAIYVNLF